MMITFIKKIRNTIVEDHHHLLHIKANINFILVRGVHQNLKNLVLQLRELENNILLIIIHIIPLHRHNFLIIIVIIIITRKLTKILINIILLGKINMSLKLL
jgi:hypothetical protein